MSPDGQRRTHEQSRRSRRVDRPIARLQVGSELGVVKEPIARATYSEYSDIGPDQYETERRAISRSSVAISRSAPALGLPYHLVAQRVRRTNRGGGDEAAGKLAMNYACTTNSTPPVPNRSTLPLGRRRPQQDVAGSVVSGEAGWRSIPAPVRFRQPAQFGRSRWLLRRGPVPGRAARALQLRQWVIGAGLR